MLYNLYRLRKHASSCRDLKRLGLREAVPPVSSQRTLENMLVRPSRDEAAREQLCRMIYSCNLPFVAVENHELQQMLYLLAPEIQWPCRKAVAERYLNAEFQRQREKMKTALTDQWMTLSMDAWSTPSNLAIIGFALGDNLLDLKDSIGESHTAEYLRRCAEAALACAKEEFGVKVAGLVTDGMTVPLIQYVCCLSVSQVLPIWLLPEGWWRVESTKMFTATAAWHIP